MIYVDITSSLKYRGLRPNGIVRTELECIGYVLRNSLENVGFCAFSYEDHRLMIIDKTQAVSLLSGTQEVSSLFHPAEPAPQPEPVSTPSAPAEIPYVPPVTLRSRVKRFLRRSGGWVYRKLPPEVREHFRNSALEGIEVIRSSRWYLQQKYTRRASPPAPPPPPVEIPAQPVEAAVVEDPEPAALTPFEVGDIYVCLGFMWDYLDLEQLYKEKNAKGFRLITLIYDLIPILMPEYANGNMPAFSKAIINQIWSSDALFCISDHSMADLAKFTEAVHAPERISRRIYLASYQPHSVPSEKPLPFKALEPGKYVLCVGTMEPRKNHELLFQIWRALYSEGPQDLLPLVIVGNLGWHTQELRSKIQLNPWLYPKYINWYSNVSDEELEWLYRNCRFTVYPSLYEGWGLPITEALDRGKLCISSNAASMEEAGQGLTELLHPLDFFSWKEKVCLYMTDDQKLQEKEREIRERRKEMDWEKTFHRFFADIAEVCAQAQREGSR